MATPFSNVNIAHMNRKQLRKIARDVRVSQPTELSALTSKATLITAIKAK